MAQSAICNINCSESTSTASPTWIGFPGQNASWRYAGAKATTSGGYEYAAAIVECEDDASIYVTLNACVYANLLNTSNYGFTIWVYPEYFSLTRPADAGLNVTAHNGSGVDITSSLIQIYSGEMQSFPESPVATRKYMETDVISSRTYVGTIYDFNFDITQWQDYSGTLWICGVGTSYSVTSAITTYAVPITVPNMRMWLQYYPGATPYLSNTSRWHSFNSENCYFQMYEKPKSYWWRKVNTVGYTEQSGDRNIHSSEVNSDGLIEYYNKVVIYHDNQWNQAELIGEEENLG